MGFASAYLSRRSVNYPLIDDLPLPGTGLIVIVPAFAEPDITLLLDSMAVAENTHCNTEVIIGVNAPPGASLKQIEQNRESLANIDRWRKSNPDPFFSLLTVDAGESSDPEWGAGMARKMLMDEALRRFNLSDYGDGVIVSLDGDCTVSSNYLSEIEKQFASQPPISGAIIRFEHPLPEADVDHQMAIAAYELHMRYHYQALKKCRMPSVYHTIGSAIAVRASAYVRAGGMSRKTAGEDFYFIQKLIPAGKIAEINTTTLFPSPRVSDRVPFGTGPTVASMLEKRTWQLLTWHPESYKPIALLNDLVPRLYRMDDAATDSTLDELPAPMSMFLRESGWVQKVAEIRKNTAGEASFTVRFYRWFNMFRVIRYLNRVHNGIIWSKTGIDEAAALLLSEITGKDCTGLNRIDLLMQFRALER
ncbi:MAG: glycosyltransferase family 2 protein [Bacteroidales bacterium]|nr:glycosyltransferase family 2 protein [Bacteroidales bacterium]